MKIFLLNKNINDIFFVVSKLKTIGFSMHYQSFEVQVTHPIQKLIIHHENLSSFLPLNQVKTFGVLTRNKYVVQRFDIGTNN